MKFSSAGIVGASLFALAVTGARAQPLPPLVANPYPGSVAANTKAGKVVPCGVGEAHHDPFCYLTKDPIAKVREFYAKDGIKFDSIPVGKDQNAKNDGLYDLEEAVRLQLNREGTGSIFAAPVEWWRTRSSADEPSYFSSVVVTTAKRAGPLGSSPKVIAAALQDDEVFARFVLRPETAAMYGDSFELMVSPERLLPLYNKHIALQGSFYRKDGDASAVARLSDAVMKKRLTEAMNASNSDLWKTPDSKVKAIDALLGDLEKEAYPTLIMIQRSRKDGVTRDPAIMAKEWRSALRFLRSK